MPAQKGKRRGASANTSERQLEFKTDGQEYAVVLKALGQCRFSLKITGTNEPVIGHVRGKLRNRGKRIAVGDLVLVGMRAFESKTRMVDILLLYRPDETRRLAQHGEIPPEIVGGVAVADADDFGGGIMFCDDVEDAPDDDDDEDLESI